MLCLFYPICTAGFILLVLLHSNIAMATMKGPPEISRRIVSQCACGDLRVEIRVSGVTTVATTAALPKQAGAGLASLVAADCHCAKCRKFHVAGLVSYLVVPKDQILIIAGSPPKYYRDKCAELGVVDRIQCSKCASKLVTQPVAGDGDVDNSSGPITSYVNMGALVDSSLPSGLAKHFRQRRKWQKMNAAIWTDATPAFSEDDETKNTEAAASRRRITGGCACGTSQYEINCELPTQLQHCYCRLCRQYSGGAYMTWVPVEKQDFAWTTSPPPPLVRTTDHGQRHFCSECGGALTIVYDDQPDTVWPAAGAMNDDSFPIEAKKMGEMLYRVVHICCRHQQSWYELPKDGLDRISEAC
jgi:hypothetical protein